MRKTIFFALTFVLYGTLYGYNALHKGTVIDAAYNVQDSLVAGKSGGFQAFLNRATNFVKDDWIPLGNPETNKFDFGRIQTFPTYNSIEGVRLRAGLASNSRFSPHFF